jgi:hypothetical protein
MTDIATQSDQVSFDAILRGAYRRAAAKGLTGYREMFATVVADPEVARALSYPQVRAFLIREGLWAQFDEIEREETTPV